MFQVEKYLQHSNIMPGQITNTFKVWLDKIWFRSYNFLFIADCILFMDSATSRITDNIINKFEKYHPKYRLVPSGLTSYCQPLDL